MSAMPTDYSFVGVGKPAYFGAGAEWVLIEQVKTCEGDMGNCIVVNVARQRKEVNHWQLFRSDKHFEAFKLRLDADRLEQTA